MTQKELAEMDIVMTEGAKDVLNTNYPILSANNTFDGVTNQAYLNLYTALVNVKKEYANSQKTGSNTALNLDAASLNTIRQTEGTNKVFVVFAAANKQLVIRFETCCSTSTYFPVCSARQQNRALRSRLCLFM